MQGGKKREVKTMNFFKNGIIPNWEDAENVEGDIIEKEFLILNSKPDAGVSFLNRAWTYSSLFVITEDCQSKYVNLKSHSA